MKKACVIGWPITHSRSPLIHNYWLKQLGIEGRYERVPIEPAALEQFISSLARSGYLGCNVTIPHKEAVSRLVTIADEDTQAIGTVNTVYLREARIFGTNTDAEGFLANLNWRAPELELSNQLVVVLGAGGSSLAVVAALLSAGVPGIAIVNRTHERAEAVRKRFGHRVQPVSWERREDVLTSASLLVNTTSLGMTGQPRMDLDLRRLPDSAVVTDIVYSPLVTPLLRQAAQRGLKTVTGLGMLLHQAVRGFELWFGQRPDVTQTLYDLVAMDIDPGYQP